MSGSFQEPLTSLTKTSQILLESIWIGNHPRNIRTTAIRSAETHQYFFRGGENVGPSNQIAMPISRIAPYYGNFQILLWYVFDLWHMIYHMPYINPYHTTCHLLHIIKLANAKADVKVQAEASSSPGLIYHSWYTVILYRGLGPQTHSRRWISSKESVERLPSSCLVSQFHDGTWDHHTSMSWLRVITAPLASKFESSYHK